ncbi:2-octaprenylphenol hydroxylase [Fontimonas thermophila]|uniref:2-octaprenylphenol hydroxylase n=1 Tax=Fontimonas thermophila TaxID=1076937 RepID=A0A1I2I7Y3_9GAMM|nr:UbiH/UbiF/VisC/COQ6 family ubiquinone biosynthesis hydroxylase [Fontimonas thermophila]SFF37690.1 2-octaprenylphenol hydroxylase [Fontimonas thermophila]
MSMSSAQARTIRASPRADVDCDVVVVGAGCVGAAAALGLHRAGLRVRLLERAPFTESDDDYDLRVYAIAPRSVRLLQRLGVWAAIAAERVSPYTHMQVWETAPSEALHFDASDIRADVLGYIVEGRVIQRHLWRALPAGVLREGAAVVDCTTDESSAVLTLDGGARLRTRLIVAADGPSSPLRKLQGIEAWSQTYAQTAIVCHVRTQRPHRGFAYQRFLDTGPLALLPLADGRCSIVWSSTEAPDLMALDDVAFCAALETASQQVLGAVEACTRRLTFPLAAQHARTYVQPRFVLAGDAAHVVHPLAGQGMNLGLGDVDDLLRVVEDAQRLRQDIGSLRVLQRYQRARRAEVTEMIAVTDGLYRAYRVRIPGWVSLRQRGLGLVNALTPLRQALVRRACGL